MRASTRAIKRRYYQRPDLPMIWATLRFERAEIDRVLREIMGWKANKEPT